MRIMNIIVQNEFSWYFNASPPDHFYKKTYKGRGEQMFVVVDIWDQRVKP